MKLPRYPKYKDSGVQWLGEVPEHWEVRRLRFVAEINPSKSEISHLDRDTLVSFLPMEAIGDEGSLDLDREKTILDVETGYTFFRDGDVVLAKITPCFENGKGAWISGLKNSIGFGTTELIVARPKPHLTTGRYLYRVFRSRPFMRLGEAEMYGAGGQKRVPESFVRNFSIGFPPIEEQSVIASFLDSEVAKIDALVEEQRRLIELLKEKRQAVISHAVTKGLNPDAPMRDSGIGWLGQVPEHWKVSKCGFYLTILPGFAFPSSGFVEEGEGTRLLRGVNVGVQQIRWEDVVYWKRSPNDSLDLYEMKAGDIVIGMDRPLISDGIRVAKVTAEDLPCLLLQRVASLEAGKKLLDDFLIALLSSDMFAAHFAPETTGVSVPHISPDQIANFVIPVPPLQEQKEIMEFLDAELSKINRLRIAATRAIDLLQERRTALISAAVTGKIDVRGEVAASLATAKAYSTGFARQLLAAEILYQCHEYPTTGRVKLQKLIHLCEYVAEIDEIHADYLRQAAGPFDNKLMFGVATGLTKQKWYAEVRDGNRTFYKPLEKAGEHKKYLAHWEDKLPRIHQVLKLLGKAQTQQCEITSTLYAAWNDLLIEGRDPSDMEIIREASDPVRWHENKANIPPDKWPKALKWMRDNGLVPRGYGCHTKHRVVPSPDKSGARPLRKEKIV